jgi:hypothetical protein
MTPNTTIEKNRAVVFMKQNWVFVERFNEGLRNNRQDITREDTAMPTCRARSA